MADDERGSDTWMEIPEMRSDALEFGTATEQIDAGDGVVVQHRDGRRDIPWGRG